MAHDILVLVEHAAGKIDSITTQLLAVGSRLAEQLGVKLVGAVIGHGLESVAPALQGIGMDKLVLVDDLDLNLPSGEVQATVMAEVARQIDPRLVLIGYSLVGMELTPAIATKLGMNAWTNCVNVELRDGAVTVTRPLFDSTMHAEIALEENETAMIALQKGSFAARESTAKQATVELLSVDVQNIPSRSKVLEITE